MTKLDFTEIEKKLNINLPNHYKTFMLKYPNEFNELGSPNSTVSYLYLINNSDRLIELNKMVNCFSSEGYYQHMLVIGEDGGGDFFFISLINESTTSVFANNHETGELEAIGSDLNEYSNYIRRIFDDN